MENNAIKVQLASPAVLNMKIEAKQTNKVTEGNFNQSFAHLLNEEGKQKVWDASSRSLPFPTAYYDLKIWSGQVDVNGSNSGISANATAFSAIIHEASERYAVPQQIIQAVIQAESSFNPVATSSAGAKGLMQLMDGTAKGLGVDNSYDPEQNINGGTKYLSMLLQKYDGHLQAALAAYNAGPTRVDRSGIKTNDDYLVYKSTLPEETQNYVAKVLSFI